MIVCLTRLPSRLNMALRRSKGKVLLVLTIIFCFYNLRSLAGQHFCDPALSMDIELATSDFRQLRDEQLIPTSSDGQPGKMCSWRLTFNELRGQRQLVLQGLPAGHRTGSSTRELQYQLLHQGNQIETGSSLQHSVSSGMFRVLAVNDNRMCVEVSLSENGQESDQARSSASLKAMMPQSGFCSRDMLSFRGNCYTVSAVHQNVTAAMASISGDAQLASFASMAEINEFVAANVAREEVLPYRRALSLSQPVRLGMFHRAADAAVLSVVRTGSGCELKPFHRPEVITMTRSSGVCVSLRVDMFGRAVLEFGDCNLPMLSLLSFPETPSALTQWDSCSAWRRSHIEALLSAARGSEDRAPPRLAAAILLPVVAVVAAILIVAADAAVIRNLSRRNPRSSVSLTETEEGKRPQDAHVTDAKADIPLLPTSIEAQV